jgi:hypothetical protein
VFKNDNEAFLIELKEKILRIETKSVCYIKKFTTIPPEIIERLGILLVGAKSDLKLERKVETIKFKIGTSGTSTFVQNAVRGNGNLPVESILPHKFDFTQFTLNSYRDIINHFYFNTPAVLSGSFLVLMIFLLRYYLLHI